MSQNEERAKVIKKIKALSEQTVERGQSEAGSEIAMRTMDKLMTAYNITMDELALNGEACKQVQFSTGSTKRTALSSVARDIAGYLDCMVWFSKDRCTDYKRNQDGTIKRCGTTGRPLKERGDSKMVFFGMDSDAEMALHLCDIIQKAIDYESALFKKHDIYTKGDNRRGALEAFQNGMARRIGYRLNEMKSAQVREVRSAQTGDRDLVVLKSAKVQEAFKTSGVKLRSASRSSGGYGNGAARAAGSEAGSKVNLNRPIGGQGGGQLLLK